MFNTFTVPIQSFSFYLTRNMMIQRSKKNNNYNVEINKNIGKKVPEDGGLHGETCKTG